MGVRDALDSFEALLLQVKEQMDTIPVHIQFVGLAVILLVAQVIVSIRELPDQAHITSKTKALQLTP